MKFFEYLSQHPEVGILFDAFMSRQTAPLGSVVAAYDFSGDETVVDVGAVSGSQLSFRRIRFWYLPVAEEGAG